MRGGIYGFTMCMSIYRALGMPEEMLLRAVTSSAASAVKREGKWGALSVGGSADLSVLSYGAAAIDISDRAKHRLTLSQGYTCRLTVKNGQILYRNGI
jgi:predicted amidohydrolase